MTECIPVWYGLNGPGGGTGQSVIYPQVNITGWPNAPGPGGIFLEIATTSPGYVRAVGHGIDRNGRPFSRLLAEGMTGSSGQFETNTRWPSSYTLDRIDIETETPFQSARALGTAEYCDIPVNPWSLVPMIGRVSPTHIRPLSAGDITGNPAFVAISALAIGVLIGRAMKR